MTDQPIVIDSESVEATLAIGAALAEWLRDGDVVLLHGDLGAGKTAFAKGIAAALRVDAVVSSPSFALVNEYDAGLAAPVTRLYHIDLFRLDSESELDSIGFHDYVAPEDGVTLIEWPERAASLLPERYLLIEIEPTGPHMRRLQFTSRPAAGWAIRFAELRDRLDQHRAERSSAGRQPPLDSYVE